MNNRGLQAATVQAQSASSSGGRTKLIIFLLVIAGLFVAGKYLPAGQWIDSLRDWIATLGVLGPIVYISVYVLATVLALPGTPLTIAAGALFGGLWGTVYISIASTLGAGAAFLVARYVARDSVSKWLADKPKFQEIEKLTARRAATVVAITRLVPLFPFNLLNYGFGLTNIPFSTYLFWSWLCMLPGTILYVVGVDAVIKLLADAKLDPITLVAVVVALVGVIFAGKLATKKLKQMENNL